MVSNDGQISYDDPFILSYDDKNHKFLIGPADICQLKIIYFYPMRQFNELLFFAGRIVRKSKRRNIGRSR